MSAPIVFLDIESDGVHPGRKPWEVAAVRREPDGSECEYHAFVSIDLSTADPFGLRVGRFYDRHPIGQMLSGADSDAPPRPAWEVAKEVARITHGAHIVGAVPNFDTETLDPLLRAHGLLPAWHYHLCDAETLAVGYLAGKGTPLAPPWSSDDLTAALGLDPTPEDERHTAMGDVRWVMRMYDAIMGGKP